MQRMRISTEESVNVREGTEDMETIDVENWDSLGFGRKRKKRDVSHDDMDTNENGLETV